MEICKFITPWKLNKLHLRRKIMRTDERKLQNSRSVDFVMTLFFCGATLRVIQRMCCKVVVFFGWVLVLWPPHDVRSLQWDSMWSPSSRRLSPMSPLPAFLERDRKWNVERRAWFCSSSTQRVQSKISMWGFKEMEGGRGDGWRWLMQEDQGPARCGFVYSGPSENHCSTVKVFHMSPLSSPAAAAVGWLLGPPQLSSCCEWLGSLATSSVSTPAQSGYNKAMALRRY